MVYRKGLAAVIKVGGKVLRESNDLVELPFGSEYSVLLKNLKSVRIMAKVSIDGQDVTGDRWLIVAPNNKLELERYISNDNLEQGNRFKFIERSTAIEKARGIKVDDSLIRIEYKTESVYTPPKIEHTYYYDHYHWYPNVHYAGLALGAINSGGLYRSMQSGASSGFQGMLQTNTSSTPVYCNNVSVCLNKQSNDVGITVPGSLSNQKFYDANGFDTESGSEVLVLQLVGRVASQEVQKPRTVETKVICQTCHKTSGSFAEFCSRCGTSLRVI